MNTPQGEIGIITVTTLRTMRAKLEEAAAIARAAEGCAADGQPARALTVALDIEPLAVEANQLLQGLAILSRITAGEASTRSRTARTGWTSLRAQFGAAPAPRSWDLCDANCMSSMMSHAHEAACLRRLVSLGVIGSFPCHLRVLQPPTQPRSHARECRSETFAGSPFKPLASAIEGAGKGHQLPVHVVKFIRIEHP